MKLRIAITIFFLFSTQIFSQVDTFDRLLKENVTAEGVVNYKNIKKNQNQLTTYIEYLKKTNPQKSWSANKEKAFWINAYNAYTIQLIIDHYPISSILKINKKGKNAWDYPFTIVGGKTYTLNHIEHEILRKKFDDPRIHVGVNCASFSCPPIANFAFTENNLEEELEKLMKKFINDPKRNNLTVKKVTLSKIFEWYKDDFTKNGKLIDYIKLYSDIELSKKAKIRFMKYNWNLNE